MKTKSQIISIVLATLVILSVLIYVFKELTADPYGKDSVSALGELRKIITSTPRDSEAFIVTKGDTVLPMADMQILFFKDEFNGQFDRFKGGYFSERESLADRLFAENPTLKAQHDQFDQSISSVQKRIKDAPEIANARWQALIQKDKDVVGVQQRAFDQSRKTYEAQVLQMIAEDKQKLENFAELIKELIINLNTVITKISNDSKVELTNLQEMLERYPQEIQMKVEKGEKDSKEIVQRLIDEQKAVVKSRKEDLVPTQKAEDDLMAILNQYDPRIKELEDEAAKLLIDMRNLEKQALKKVNDHIIKAELRVKTVGSSDGIFSTSRLVVSNPGGSYGLYIGDFRQTAGYRGNRYFFLRNISNKCSGISEQISLLFNKWFLLELRKEQIEGFRGLIKSTKAERRKALIPWNNRYNSLVREGRERFGFSGEGNLEKRFLKQRKELKDAFDLEQKKLARMEEDKGGNLLATMDFQLNAIMKSLSTNLKIQAALKGNDHEAISLLDEIYADNYRSMKNHESFQAALKANNQEEFADLMPNYAKALASLERSKMVKEAIDKGSKNELAKLSPEYRNILQSLEVNQKIEAQINKNDLAKYEDEIIGFVQLTQAKKALEDTSDKFVYEEILSEMVAPLEEQLTETRHQKSQFMERALGNKQLELIDTYYYKFLGLLEEKSFLKIRAGSRGQFKIPSNAKYIFAERRRNNGEHIFWFIKIEDNNVNFHLSNSNAHIASEGDIKRWVYSHTLN